MSDVRSDIPVPPVDADSKQFWDAASRSELMVGHCQACQKSHFFPRQFCPFCWSLDVGLKKASGKATIYSFSILRRVERPFALAYVTLEEGPSMLTNIVDCPLDAIRVGQAVEVVFAPTDGGPLVPMFKPV